VLLLLLTLALLNKTFTKNFDVFRASLFGRGRSGTSAAGAAGVAVWRLVSLLLTLVLLNKSCTKGFTKGSVCWCCIANPAKLITRSAWGHCCCC
jgi:hypothetical protein